MSIGSSDIRVLVDWIESSVFAGEEIKCDIIFKNIALDNNSTIASVHPNSNVTNEHGASEKRQTTSASKLKSPTRFTWSTPIHRGHRPTLSLNFPNNYGNHQQNRRQSYIAPNKYAEETRSHKRSVSIKYIGTSEKGNEQGNSLSNLIERSRRIQKGHGRSASLQTISQKQAFYNPQQSQQTSVSLSSPHGNIPISNKLNKDYKAQERSTESSYNLQNRVLHVSSNNPVAPISPQFKLFPKTTYHLDLKPAELNSKELSELPKTILPSMSGQNSPAIIVAQPSSLGGTPRDSGELYTASNNSSEVFTSFSQSPFQSRKFMNSEPNSGHSNISSAKIPKSSDTLMMGYAQIHGSFTLDSSLISQAPFEEVKKKGIIGGQGGGVVGVETNKRDSGLLRGFGWANIAAIGDLLGSNELSSIKEFREILSSRSIPLLATPQSILFVDLKLHPGETKCFHYSFRLPNGLPPSHRGKAIKIMYKLVIGIQQPGGIKEQQVKSIDIPFRVLGSVDSNGKPLGHDLMCPYIILQDQASIKALPGYQSRRFGLKKPFQPDKSTYNNFVSYVDSLLSKTQNKSSSSLFSPSDFCGSRRSSSIEEPTSVKEAIDMAILRSNIVADTQKSPNRFEIARSGRKVAVFMLTRSSYRLGETIDAAIDFTDAKIPCYAIHISLESSERVDTSISLRSEASILRFTRKTYVTYTESTLFSRRIMFTPTIPTSATPEFVTSGVSLDWRIRIEFVTPKLENGNKIIQGYPELLEKISVDDNGTFFGAVEALDCDSFQIAIPLRVYGIQTAIDGELNLLNWHTI